MQSNSYSPHNIESSNEITLHQPVIDEYTVPNSPLANDSSSQSIKKERDTRKSVDENDTVHKSDTANDDSNDNNNDNNNDNSNDDSNDDANADGNGNNDNNNSNAGDDDSDHNINDKCDALTVNVKKGTVKGLKAKALKAKALKCPSSSNVNLVSSSHLLKDNVVPEKQQALSRITNDTILEIYTSSVKSKQLELDNTKACYNNLRELFNNATSKIVELKEIITSTNSEMKLLNVKLSYKSSECVRLTQDNLDQRNKILLLEEKIKSYNQLTEKILQFKKNDNGSLKRSIIVPTSSVDSTYRPLNKKSKTTIIHN